MYEEAMEQYERLRKGYPQLFADAQKIAKLIIKAHKKGMEPSETWRYLQALRKIESRKKGYRPVPDMVINIFLDAKLTRDEDREEVKEYYRNVISTGTLKEYICFIIRNI
jgi:hypothetical protein